MVKNLMPSDFLKTLGYEFANRDLLLSAFTHRSENAVVNYERLEFLGDRVLGLVIASLLLKAFPAENEGDLSRRFHALVKKESLAAIAHKAGLQSLIRMGRSEKNINSRENEAILADVFEAFLGAVFLDGGLHPAKQIIENLFTPVMLKVSCPPQDCQTRLQEWAQAKGLGLPSYKLLHQKGQ